MRGAGSLGRAGGYSPVGRHTRPTGDRWLCLAPGRPSVVYAVTPETPPPEPEAPAEGPEMPSTPMPMVVWVHDGPVCVTVVDSPAPHATSGICRCAACRAHNPDLAVRWF